MADELTHVLIKKTMPYYPDGITRVEVVEGQVVEMSVKWVEIFERENWGVVTSDSLTAIASEDEDDDATATGEGADASSEGDESGDSEGAESPEESGGSDDGNGSEDGGEGGSDDGEEEAEEPQASPKAIEIAEELTVDLSAVTGTGTDGLITAEDVRAAAESAPES